MSASECPNVCRGLKNFYIILKYFFVCLKIYVYLKYISNENLVIWIFQKNEF